jgi:PAS domain S-box-containing protein
MMVTDPRHPDNVIVLANQAFLDLTGYSAGEVIGRNPRFLQGPDTTPQAVARIREATRDQRESMSEILNYRKDGAPFWNQLHISPIHDERGRLMYFFGSQSDVTELRKVRTLQATERRLLKEVDHRARNVLAVVNGIVRLSRADDAKLYAAAIQQRIQALSAAHGLLAEGGWRAVALDEIVRQQLGAVDPERISVAGPDIMVPASAVQPLALVVHELLFNATVHGALSGSGGTLEVRWDRTLRTDGFALRWKEVDGPAPPDTRRAGFGTMILRNMVETQLRGQFDREWSRSGVVVTIDIPGGAGAAADPGRN